MKIYKPLILLFLPVAAAASTLTLQDAISAGMKNSFDIRSEKMSVTVSREKNTEQQAVFDPVFSASADGHGSSDPTAYAPYNFNYLKEKTFEGTAGLTKLHRNGMIGQASVKTLKYDTNDPYQNLDPIYKTIFQMSITQPLLKNYGKDINLSDVKKSELDMREAGYSLYWKMVNKAQEIETAYYSVSKAQDMLSLAEQSQTLAKSLLDSDKKRYAAGIVAVTEVQQAETAVAARQEQVIAAQTDLRSAKNTLENLTAMDTDMDATEAEPMDKSFGALNRDDEYKKALNLRPDLEVQRIELQKQDITVKYLKNQELPELDLASTLGLTGMSGNAKTANHFDGSYQDSITDAADTNGFDWRIGLSFSVPLGQRGAKARTSAAEAEKMRSVYTMKNMERNVKTDVKNAMTVMSGGQDRYAVAETFISLAQVTLDQEMKKLKEGMSDTFHILKYQDDLIDAKKRAVAALYDYNVGTAMLYRASGTNLDRFGFKIGD